jgi:endonuclease I
MSEARLSFRAHEGPADHRVSEMGDDMKTTRYCWQKKRSYSQKFSLAAASLRASRRNTWNHVCLAYPHGRDMETGREGGLWSICVGSRRTYVGPSKMSVDEVVWERTKITPLSIRAHTLVAVSFEIS